MHLFWGKGHQVEKRAQGAQGKPKREKGCVTQVPHNAGSTYLRVFLRGDLPQKLGQSAKHGIAGNLRLGPRFGSPQCQMDSRLVPHNNGPAKTLDYICGGVNKFQRQLIVKKRPK
jgi:hypothetical protein